MRRKERPATEPKPVDGERIRRLVARAAADSAAGVVMHQHPALNELADLCGILLYYRFRLQEPRTAAEIEDFCDRAIQAAAPEEDRPVAQSATDPAPVNLEERRRKRDSDATR